MTPSQRLSVSREGSDRRTHYPRGGTVTPYLSRRTWYTNNTVLEERSPEHRSTIQTHLPSLIPEYPFLYRITTSRCTTLYWGERSRRPRTRNVSLRPTLCPQNRLSQLKIRKRYRTGVHNPQSLDRVRLTSESSRPVTGQRYLVHEYLLQRWCPVTDRYCDELYDRYLSVTNPHWVESRGRYQRVGHVTSTRPPRGRFEPCKNHVEHCKEHEEKTYIQNE